MPIGAPRPTLSSFLQSARWTVSSFMLSRVGSAKHDIRFVLLPTFPFLLSKSADPFDQLKGLKFIQRTIDFSRIGLVCVSGTSPSIREVVFSATLADASALFFGTKTTLRTGFPEKDQYGSGKSYLNRVDFTKIADANLQRAELPVLTTGMVVYPFSGASAGVVHKSLYEQHKSDLGGELVPYSVFSADELNEIGSAFDQLPSCIMLDVAVILDSEELLAFHWTLSTERFAEDFYNAGVISAT